MQFWQNPYAVFLRVVRVWRLIVALLRLGQAFGIDKILTHRPPGTLVVYCPVCPEPGVNVVSNGQKTPKHLRYDLRDYDRSPFLILDLGTSTNRRIPSMATSTPESIGRIVTLMMCLYGVAVVIFHWILTIKSIWHRCLFRRRLVLLRSRLIVSDPSFVSYLEVDVYISESGEQAR